MSGYCFDVQPFLRVGFDFLGGTALLAIADEGEPLIKSFGFQIGELLAHVVDYLEFEGDCDEFYAPWAGGRKNL